MMRVREISGKFCFVETRDKFPKRGDSANPIGFGTMMNVASELHLIYIAEFSLLQIKLKPARAGLQW